MTLRSFLLFLWKFNLLPPQKRGEELTQYGNNDLMAHQDIVTCHTLNFFVFVLSLWFYHHLCPSFPLFIHLVVGRRKTATNINYNHQVKHDMKEHILYVIFRMTSSSLSGVMECFKENKMMLFLFIYMMMTMCVVKNNNDEGSGSRENY